jgi:ribosomal protein L11 methyltransferase
VPYRVDIPSRRDDWLTRLIDLGALDVEASGDDGIAALMPDGVDPQFLAAALGVGNIEVSPATGRDDGSVWVLDVRPMRVGRVEIAPPGAAAATGAVRLLDTPAFGSGRHPTTRMCLEILDELTRTDVPHAVLDVGTGSGVLALAALALGVPRVLGIDTDPAAVRAARDNARLNGVADRFEVTEGGPDVLSGTWPLVLANVLAAPLVEMAPALARRVGRHGQLVLSGIPSAVQPDVDRAYRRLGMRRAGTRALDGWIAMRLQASW